MMQPVAPGADQPGKDSADKPADEHILPPISEDDGHAAPDDGGAQDQQHPPADDGKDQRRPEPQKPPSDQLRDKIASRFEQKRIHDPENAGDDRRTPVEDNGDAGAEGGEGGADDKDGAAREEQQAPADQLTLKVFGKDHVKSIDEIAVLADMTPEEVRANPERALRFAQRELATTQRLEEAKRIHRETTSRATTGDQDTRADRRAPDQERTEAGPGETSDQHEQPGPTKGKVDYKQLVEAIQIEDPEKAAEALQQALETIAESAKSAARETVTEGEVSRKVKADFEEAGKAVQEFTKDHAELAKNPYAGKLIAAGLHDEYRDDLVKALVAEGEDQDEAERLVKTANEEQVAQAHRQRRIQGDPNVRRIDKAMISKAYERVSGVLGVKQQTTPQDLASTRHERKANLSPQPRRASVPPATTPTAAKPQSRSAAVAELASGRGQKGPSSSR